jgi:hypothetical protein
MISESCEVIIITSTKEQLDYIKTFESDYPQHKCSYENISIPTFLSVIGKILDKAIPFTRVLSLKKNLPFFKQLDALVAPEKTSLLLRTHFGLDHLKFIFAAHGSGDRKFGFNKEFAQFDLIFVSGPKTQKRMQEVGIFDKAKSNIVGYPKFDVVGAYTKPRKRYFDNDKLTVLYNPHFSPHLSSWFKMGMGIMDYFYKSDKFNLIFAPHVMLFARKLQISQEQFSMGWVRRIPQRYYECSHILIDTNSIACSDMSYTLSADIYIGDVSSQFHEFLINPRPCLFANAYDVDWKDDSSYLNWHTGPVFNELSQLDSCLEQAISNHGEYIDFQKELFASTFEINETPSSVRAARAIYEYMANNDK